MDNVIAQLLDALAATGVVSPTEKEKKYALAVFKKSPAYKAITEVLRRGTEGELEKAAELVRTKFLAGFRKPMLQAARGLPHPVGGRLPALSDHDRTAVCKDIGALIVEGYPLKESVARVAKRCGVSSRTIYRVWQERVKYSRGST